ncbi:MAG: hypothetical protein QOG57_6654 [Pseudonocardiales bacterium]|nr:hypothetical protein [Pseudonocardiales bacterium]
MVAFGYTLLTEQRGSRGLVSDLADAMVAVQPRADLVRWFDDVVGATVHKIGRLPISWDRDGATAVARAHEQFRWFAGGCKVNAELPGTAAFAFRQPVRPTRGRGRVDRVRTRRPRANRGVRPFAEAGFRHVAVAQVGGDTQPEFLEYAAHELIPALREAYGKAEEPVIRRR